VKLLNLLNLLWVKIILIRAVVHDFFRLIFFVLFGPFIEILYLDLSHFHSLTAILLVCQIKLRSFCIRELTTSVVASEIAELSNAF